MNRFVRCIAIFILSATPALAQLSGTYTIGSGGSYGSFTAAVSALTSQGVSGPVTFNVLTGTYNEQIQIGSISGASASNTVTFQAQSGNAADVTLFSTPTSSNNYVIRLLQTDYVTFQKLTLTASGSTSYGIVVKLDGDANNNRFLNNVITGVSTTGGSANLCLIYSDGDSLDNTAINGNTLTDGSFGVYLDGASQAASSTGLQINNNTFTNSGYDAVYSRYQNGLQINGNIMNESSSANRGIELNYCDGAVEIRKNKITLPTNAYGIYLYSCDGGTGAPTARGLISDNFVSVGGNSTAYGLYIYACTNFDVYYNSVNITSTNTTAGQALRIENAGGSSINIVNNIFANQGGGLAYANVGVATIVNTSNYNNLYTNGNYIGYWNGLYHTTLAAFQAASGKDANSVNVYPSFTSASDLHTLTPWLDGKGTPLASVTDDIDGVARNGATPDIGADEFTANPATTTPLAGSYTIGSGGNYTTFAAAQADLMIKGVSAPVTFNILNGLYIGQLRLLQVPGSSATNTITFQSQSGSAATVTLFYAAAGATDNYVVRLEGADYIRFLNLTLASNNVASSTYAQVINIFGDVEDLRVTNCVITGTSTTGSATSQVLIYADNSLYTSRVITGNTFTDGSYAIYLDGIDQNSPSSGLQINNNTFTNTGYNPIWARYLNGLQINSNIMNPSGNANRGLELNYCDGGVEIRKNKITLSTNSYGIYLYSCDGGTGLPTPRALIANNFVSIGGNSTAYGLYVYACTNLDVYDNSVNITSTNTTAGQALRIENAGGSGVNIVNNVFANHGGGLAYANVGAASIVNTSNYNDLYSTGNYIGYWNGVYRTTMAAFQAASGKDANSVNVYPSFTTTTDLHTLTPWLDGKGTPLASVTDDIDGVARNGATPDIGADEFTANPATTTPLAGSYTIGSGGNYATFAAAQADLMIKGVSAPVAFNVLNGVYIGQLRLLQVPGSSATNTITFQSQSGNAASVTLFYAAAGAADNYVVRLEGADYIRFRNMTIASNNIASSTYAQVFNCFGDVEDLRLQNNFITGTQTTGSAASQVLVYADNSLYTSRVITGNTFTDGSYAMYLDGIDQNSPSTGLRIDSNTISNTGYNPIWVRYQNGVQINSNIMNPSGNANRGLELNYCDGAVQITKNKIILPTNSYGIYLYSCDGGTGLPTPRGLIANNFVSIGGNSTAYGLYIYACTNLDYYHNSVNITSTYNAYGQALRIENAGGSSINIVNNILANQGGGYSYYNAGAASIVNTSNNNDLYSTGNYIGYWGGADRVSMAAFQAASGKDANSVSAFPYFVSATDLHTPSPWLNGKGAPLASVTDDIDGAARNGATPDIGADEFTPDPSTVTPLAGTYTIGSGGNYATFAAAKSDLLLKGVSAAVTFDVLSGTYTEQMNLPPVPGADAAKTVTFESQSGNPLNVTVYHAAAGTGDNYIFRLDGADYIHIRTMTLASNTLAGSSYARVIEFFGGCEDDHISGNIITGTATTGASGHQASVYADNSLFASRFIDGNTFNDGSYGVYMDGINTAVLSNGLAITNNAFVNSTYGIFARYQNGLQINGNTMTASVYGNRGIELNYCDGAVQITKNKISLPSNAYGIYLYACDGGTGLPTPRGLIANNFVNIGGNSTAYGLYIYACTNLDYYHNSVNITSSSTLYGQALRIENSSGSSINLVNNIFANQGGGYSYANAGAASIVNTSNYNDIYTTGAVLGYWGGADRSNLAALKTASGKDANSVSLAPGYTSATNLHRLTAALDTLATPLAAVTDDIDSEPRDLTKPDIGADERVTVAVVPSLSINDVTAAEGNSGTTNFLFTVNLSSTTAQTVTVSYATANGTATAPGDYGISSGSLTFLSGELSKQISVAVVGDAVNEPVETFSVALSSPANATIADGQGIGTITNDDAVPAISVNDITVTEGNAGTTNAIFTVSLNQAGSQTITVDYATANGTATTGDNDYGARSGTLTFPAGTTVRSDTIQVNGDATNEPNETFFLNLTNPSNATIADNQGLATIQNDDGVPSIAVNDLSVTEGNAGTANAVFTLTLSSTSSQTVTVNYATANGTATAGPDFTAKNGTATFSAGVTAVRETVLVSGELLNEADETFFLNLSGAANASIADAQGQATIVNDDPLPAISIGDVLVTEGNSGTTPAQFTLRLTPPSGRSVSVSYATANGTAGAPGDYAAASGTATFAAGETVKTAATSVVGEATNESDETFFMNLTSPVNATVADAQGIGTIVNDDVPGANLALALTDLADPVTAGATVHYRIDVTNAGPDPASSVTVRDTLPAGVTYQNATGTGWSCSQSGGIVTCTQASLAVGAASPIFIDITAPGSPGPIRSGAVVGSSTSDNNLANNVDAEVTTVLSQGIDLAISKLDAPDPVTAGGTLTYTIVVTNAGPASATDVEVRDALPAGMTCLTASGNGWTCTIALGVAVCTRSSLAAGASPPITIAGTAPPGSGSISNTASVSAAEADPNMLNNSVTVSTAVTAVSTTAQAIQNLIGQVQCLVSSGALSPGNGNALLAKLHAALQAVDRGKKINQLQAFNNSVEALIRSGRLAPSDGQPMITAGNIIVGTLPANEFGSSDPHAAIAMLNDAAPVSYGLGQNFPNPFNPSTNIRFAVAAPGMVSLRVYNMLGEEIARLIDGPMPAGTFEVTWTTNGVQSGVYLYRLQTSDFVESRKLILLK